MMTIMMITLRVDYAVWWGKMQLYYLKDPFDSLKGHKQYADHDDES